MAKRDRIKKTGSDYCAAIQLLSTCGVMPKGMFHSCQAELQFSEDLL